MVAMAGTPECMPAAEGATRRPTHPPHKTMGAPPPSPRPSAPRRDAPEEADQRVSVGQRVGGGAGLPRVLRLHEVERPPARPAGCQLTAEALPNSPEGVGDPAIRPRWHP